MSKITKLWGVVKWRDKKKTNGITQKIKLPYFSGIFQLFFKLEITVHGSKIELKIGIKKPSM